MKVYIADILRNYRMKERYSQEEMADFFNVSQATYHNWESGKAQIQLKYYPGIAKQCKISLSEILPDDFNA